MLTPNELVEHFEKGQAWLKDLQAERLKSEEQHRKDLTNLIDFIHSYYIVNYCETNNKEFISQEGCFYFVHYGYVRFELHKLAVMRWEDVPQVIVDALKATATLHPFQTPIGALVPSYCPEPLKNARHAEEY